MPNWITIPTFADNEVVSREDIQNMYDNLDLLHLRNYEHTQAVELDGTPQNTTSSTLERLTGEKYSLEIETEGGDIVVEANLFMKKSSTGADQRVGFALAVDGEFYNGITSSQQNFTREFDEQQQQFPGLVWVVRGLTAGIHTLELYFRRVSGSETITSDGARRDYLWTIEL